MRYLKFTDLQYRQNFFSSLHVCNNVSEIESLDCLREGVSVYDISATGATETNVR